MQKLNRANCVFGFFFVLTIVVSAFPAYCQQGAANPELQQKFAALKQSLAQPRRRFRFAPRILAITSFNGFTCD